ncbi:hypothetical protein [Bradyrhizobium cenepequi]
MPAFKPMVVEQINKNIGLMFSRLKKVSTKTISHDDFINLFVPRDHRDAFREMAILADTGYGRSARYKWGEFNLRFSLNDRPGKYPPPIPRRLIVQEDAPEDLIYAITEWSRNGGDASGDFGRVRKLFEVLNDKLSKSEMRFVWPSILAICGADETNVVAKQAAADLQQVRTPAGVVSLPPGLRAACRKTADTIAMVGLIPHDVQYPEQGEVTIEAVNGSHYSEPDLGGFHGLS